MDNTHLISTSLFKSLFTDNVSMMMLVDADDGKIIEANKSACYFYGYSRTQFAKMYISQINLTSEDKLNAELKKAKQGKKNYFRFEHKLSSGEKRAVEIYTNLINFNKKKVLFSIIHDITDLEKQKLENKKVHFSLLKAELIARIGHWEFDLNNLTVRASEGARKIYGLGLKNENLTIPEAQAIPLPEYRKFLDTSLKNLVEHNESYDVEFKIRRRNDYEIRTIHSVAEYLSENNTVFGVIRDITEQKITEKRINMLSAAVEQSSDAVMITDIKGNVEYVNSKFTELTGYSEKELLHKSLKELNIENKHLGFYNKMWEVINTSFFWKGELQCKKKDGTLFWEQISITCIYDTVGKPVNFLAIKEDITLRKITEQSLKEQNEEYAALNEEYKTANEELIIAKEKAEASNRLKTEFINNMSHEIRTPMNAMLGFSNLLDNDDITDEKRKFYISIIQNSGNQLMRVIDDILEIAKLGSKQVEIIKQKVCINHLLSEHLAVYNLSAQKKGVTLRFVKTLADTECTILTDRVKLNKIISNLLENAMKFTNKGFIEFGCRHENNEIVIYVKDTGIGIKPENQKKVFERFTQEEMGTSRNFGGLGLGLSIAKENVELLGGRISLTSEKGKGSTFFVHIPYTEANIHTKTKLTSVNENYFKRKDKNYTVLIVEDEEVNLLYLDAILRNYSLNMNVLHAKNGMEAIKICKKNKNIDLILMDIKMPVMDGLEATKRIKKFRSDIKIIAQTAYTGIEEKKQASMVGCDDFISKPIAPESINRIMKKYLILE
ncbi:MAG: PAS domain S-box protein [Bacteroidales bacterium]|nr:PAS domain S-box protein [Bacteroidales bacterium]